MVHMVFYRVQLHWAKSDTRSVVDLWYEEKGYDTPTYVIFGEAPSFTYYLTHDSRFDQKYMDDITFEYENKETNWEQMSIGIILWRNTRGSLRRNSIYLSDMKIL